MMRRSGHIRERSPGSFELRWRVDGKVHTATFRGGKREAEKGTSAPVERCGSRDRCQCSGQSYNGGLARSVVRNYSGRYPPDHFRPLRGRGAARSAPPLGAIRLRDLTPRDIQAAFTGWAQGGRHRGSGALARSTLGLLRKMLYAALQRALELELIARHPMASLRKRLPTGRAGEAKVIGADAIGELLARADGTAYHSAVLLASACGLRRGEACGLRWGAVDLNAAALAIGETRVPARRGIVTGPTKTGRSRSIAIPPFAVALLRQHRIGQAEMLLRLGVRLDDNAYVCARADGSPLNPMSLTAWCRANAPIGFHGLRHSHASLLLMSGASVKAVSGRLSCERGDDTFGLRSSLAGGRRRRSPPHRQNVVR